MLQCRAVSRTATCMLGTYPIRLPSNRNRTGDPERQFGETIQEGSAAGGSGGSGSGSPTVVVDVCVATLEGVGQRPRHVLAEHQQQPQRQEHDPHQGDRRLEIAVASRRPARTRRRWRRDTGRAGRRSRTTLRARSPDRSTANRSRTSSPPSRRRSSGARPRSGRGRHRSAPAPPADRRSLRGTGSPGRSRARMAGSRAPARVVSTVSTELLHSRQRGVDPVEAGGQRRRQRTRRLGQSGRRLQHLVEGGERRLHGRPNRRRRQPAPGRRRRSSRST